MDPRGPVVGLRRNPSPSMRWAFTTVLILVIGIFDQSRVSAAELPSLDDVIASLRAEEAKYKDVEYTLRTTTRKLDPTAPDAPGQLQSEATRRVVLQGDRIWFQGALISHAMKREVRLDEVSAYDGERTRSTIAGNCVNIHIGRFEHPDVFPVHGLSLNHYHLNFPLSVYLSGGEAIHAHPKYGRFNRESGSVNEFTRVEAAVEGEEQVDGLRCLKLKVNRWYYSKDAPILQCLWLAMDRNYLCVKEQTSRPKSKSGDLPTHEMRVETLREIAPGVWFPMKVAVVVFDREALQRKERVVSVRTETVVERAELHPTYDVLFFRDVEIPPGLPLFTIRDRMLEGSAPPEPIADEAEEKAKLQRIVDLVREEEGRYADIEVKARVDYKHVGTSHIWENVFAEQTKMDHSVLQGALAYFTEHSAYETFGGVRSEQNQVKAFDGDWTRSLTRMSGGGQKDEQRLASLRKGGVGKAEGRSDGIPVLRPHTFLVRDDWLYGPLADLLVSPWHDKVNKYRLRFRYCGEEVLDGRPCVRLRGEVTTREGQPPHNFFALWLATDRNYIPIKLEPYGGNLGMWPIPTGMKRCEDLREIAPGVWYPFRTTQLGFDNWQDMARGRITLNWRSTYEVESAVLSPKVEPGLFHDVVAPAGTKVQVMDEEGEFLGEFDQVDEGVPEIVPARYLSMLADAKVRDEEQKARQQAIDALIGKPAPEFPADATWLNGGPFTWSSLRGKLVVLDFWAEWCGPCRNDLPLLSRLHAGRESNHLTIIGVHPPGSTPEAVKKVMDEFHLDYPICVDVPPGKGLRTWGDLFGRFAVRAIPHAVAVNDQGVIIACGRLQDVVAKAKESIEKP